MIDLETEFLLVLGYYTKSLSSKGSLHSGQIFGFFVPFSGP